MLCCHPDQVSMLLASKGSPGIASLGFWEVLWGHGVLLCCWLKVPSSWRTRAWSSKEVVLGIDVGTALGWQASCAKLFEHLCGCSANAASSQAGPSTPPLSHPGQGLPTGLR